MSQPPRTARFLFAIHTRWTETAGVTQVLMELMNQLTARGHHCEKFSLDEAFPRRLGRLRGPFTIAMFQRRLLAYIREHGHRFDVIQTEHALLPYPRERYRFDGTLVVKSQGLIHFYRDYLRALPDGSRGSLLTQLMRGLGWWAYGGVSAADRAFAAADQIHVMNTDELAFVRDQLGHGDKCVLVPNGIAASERAALNASCDIDRRLASDTIAFVGIWSLRKGSREFPAIIRAVRQRRPSTRFRMIGTHFDAGRVRRDLAPEDREAVEVVPHFERAELPRLLADARAGVFPSFVEGFGLGYLEMLTAGVPTIAWDAPGPRDINDIPGLPLTPIGDTAASAAALLDLFELDRPAFAALSTACMATGERFNWPRVATIMEDAILGPLRPTPVAT